MPALCRSAPNSSCIVRGLFLTTLVCAAVASVGSQPKTSTKQDLATRHHAGSAGHMTPSKALGTKQDTFTRLKSLQNSLRQVGKSKATNDAAQFNVPYNGTVNHNTGVRSYHFSKTANMSLAARVTVIAEDAEKEFPVQFTVREQMSLLSWQVPLLLDTSVQSYKYNHVSRTLCPKGNDPNMTRQDIYVEVSSMSLTNVSYTLLTTLVYLEIMTGQEISVSVTPSEPKFYQYHFPKSINSVVVKVESDSRLCMVASVQDVHCPVFDLVRNVEFIGMYQTVTKKGALTVTRDYFKDATFFVVLVVRPNNLECGGSDEIAPQPPDDIAGLFYRQKNIKVVITASVSEKDYIIATVSSVAWFLGFYVLAFVVSIVYHVRDTDDPAAIQPVPHPKVQRDTQAAGPFSRSDNSEHERLLGATGSDQLINPGADHTYGSIEPSGDERSAFVQGGETGDNGIPHRIPPPGEDNSDTSDIDISDIDMLNDIDQEKDIVRTKTTLYVADLARKSTKKLAKKYKLYFWNLIPIAIFYGLPVVQLVITYQTVVNMTGNEDICYYNFYCANPLGVLSSFNNVFSNIGYVMLGILFLILVLRRDLYYRKMVKLNSNLEKVYGIPQHFGLFYAMGLSLIMEGILSGCYHVCPSYSNYQFDTSFMYMTAWLLMLKIYQTRHPDINAHSSTAYCTVAVVILLAVIGVVYDTVLFWVVFTIAYMTMVILISINVYYMGRWKMDLGMFKRAYQVIRADRLHCAWPMYPDRMILLTIGNLINLSCAILGLVARPRDFATYLLGIFIANLLMYCAFYIIMKLRSRERIMLLPSCYILLACIVWGFAFYFFLAKLTSWELTPAQSRQGNRDCILFNFFDDHDVWHFLSAMSLFFSFMVLLTLDDDLLPVPRDQIPVF